MFADGCSLWILGDLRVNSRHLSVRRGGRLGESAQGGSRKAGYHARMKRDPEEAEAMRKAWRSPPPGRLIGRGHSAGDLLEAFDWELEAESLGELSLKVTLPDHLRNPRGDLFGGFTATYVDLVALLTDPSWNGSFAGWMDDDHQHESRVSVSGARTGIQNHKPGGSPRAAHLPGRNAISHPGRPALCAGSDQIPRRRPIPDDILICSTGAG